MIPIADLQIGNRVLYNGMEAIVYSIRGPYPDVSERFNNKPTVDLILGGMISATEDELEPILLTEDILVNKIGFDKVTEGDGEYYGLDYQLQVNEDVFISYSDDFSCGLWGSKDRMGEFGVLPKWEKIKNFHGLQNMVLILTGIELEIKP